MSPPGKLPQGWTEPFPLPGTLPWASTWPPSGTTFSLQPFLATLPAPSLPLFPRCSDHHLTFWVFDCGWAPPGWALHEERLGLFTVVSLTPTPVSPGCLKGAFLTRLVPGSGVQRASRADAPISEGCGEQSDEAGCGSTWSPRGAFIAGPSSSFLSSVKCPSEQGGIALSAWAHPCSHHVVYGPRHSQRGKWISCWFSKNLMTFPSPRVPRSPHTPSLPVRAVRAAPRNPWQPSGWCLSPCSPAPCDVTLLSSRAVPFGVPAFDLVRFHLRQLCGAKERGARSSCKLG